MSLLLCTILALYRTSTQMYVIRNHYVVHQREIAGVCRGLKDTCKLIATRKQHMHPCQWNITTEYILNCIQCPQHMTCEPTQVCVQVLSHAFTYHWKLWTIPEVLELLSEAGFQNVHVWIRCMIVSCHQSVYEHLTHLANTCWCLQSKHQHQAGLLDTQL